MPIKDHNHKVKLLAIGFISPIVLIIGLSNRIQDSVEVPTYKNIASNTIDFLRTYEEETRLIMPWFNITACTLIILNNGVQLANHIKKKE